MFFALKYKKLKIIYDLTEVGFFIKIEKKIRIYINFRCALSNRKKQI